MTRIELAIITMIKYRWNTDKLFMRWNEVAEVVKKETELWLDKDTQLFLRDQKYYREEVFEFLDTEERYLDIPLRAKQHNRTQLEYIAYLFGIKPEKAVSGCQILQLDLSTKFKHDDSIRKESTIRKNDPKRSNGDCVIRAVAMALQMPYDEVLTQLEKLQNTDPTKGVSDWHWCPFVIQQGWQEIKIKPWKKINLHRLFNVIPTLKTIPMLVAVSRHVFFVNSAGTNIDTWDAAYKTIENILVKKENHYYVTSSINRELSFEGITRKLLTCRRKNPNETWLTTYEKIGIKWYDGQNIRRSLEFYKQVENTKEHKWSLHKKHT